MNQNISLRFFPSLFHRADVDMIEYNSMVSLVDNLCVFGCTCVYVRLVQL